MLLVANLANTKACKKPKKLTETLAHGYSSVSTQQGLSNDYQNDRFQMFSFSNLCIFVLWGKVALALERLMEAAKQVMEVTN